MSHMFYKCRIKILFGISMQLDQISHVRYIAMPVKDNANCFLFQKVITCLFLFITGVT